jgi:RNA polymerase II subunit A-like phosphatase
MFPFQVCIIDDRGDVWNFSPNLIQVKPYHFFAKTGDINAPPGLAKQDEDNKTGFDFSKGIPVPILKAEDGGSESVTPEVVEADSTTAGDTTNQSSKSKANHSSGSGVGKTDLSNDLLLTDDDSDTAGERAADGGSESSSEGNSTEASVSTPKPGVPDYFDDEGSDEGKANKPLTPPNPVNSEPAAEKESLPVLSSPPAAEEDTPEEPDSPITVAEKEPEVKEDGEVSDSSPPCPPASPKAADGLVDVEDPDDYLLYLEDILKRVHEAYFHLYDDLKVKKEERLPDTKQIVPYVRRQVLKVGLRHSSTSTP